MRKDNDYERSKEYWVRFMVISFFLVFIAIFSGGACYQVVTAFWIDKKGISAIGVVNSIEHLSNTETESLRYGISFKYQGNHYRLFSKVRTNEAIYTMNERVPIKFMSNNPNKAVIDSAREKYTGYIVPIVIGLLILMFIIRFLKTRSS